MTRTEAHQQIQLGSVAPHFDTFPAADGLRYSIDSFDDADILVVVFLSNGCPTVRGYDERLKALQADYQDARVRVVAVNANNPHLSPADTYEEMVKRADEAAYNFPYLQDATGELARSFGAVSTPHALVFDRTRRLCYRGRIDDSRNPAKVERSDLREAVAELVENGNVTVPETQPFGCAIVW
jgi:hypothetical protein